MNNLYHPDVWVVVRFAGRDVPNREMYKILAGWYGGYTTGDSWKLNSGITKISHDDQYYFVDGYSGSTYRCHKDAERVNMMTDGIFQSLRTQSEQSGKDVKIDIVPIDSVKDLFR